MADCPQCDDEHDRGSPKCPGRRVGSTVANKFYLEALLGVGGAGAVYTARKLSGDTASDAPVALKLLRKELTRNKEQVARFQREAESAQAVQHAGFVKFLSYGTDEHGGLYLEMELLRGETLDQRMARGPVPRSLALSYAIQVLDALQSAHSLGIVHRDLKPENLFLHKPTAQAEGEVLKILDLGTAKVTTQQRMTRTGELLGTPLYMSPEQMRSSKNVDPRSDVYSVGAILFELLTGERVVRGHTFEVMAYVAQGQIRRNPRDVKPELPPWLDQTVARALALNVDDRFPSAKAMKSTLVAEGGFWRRLFGT